ncbi:MAG: phosphohydrolase [Firmicutes bacterium HGW-Firmicutes-13]|nr:MAG: phosphohydrolase [Firmicutes bacterium HGW-Firmicutes-13]
MQEIRLINLEDVKKDPQVNIYIQKADEHLGTLGFTEHSFRHSNLVAKIAYNILSRLGYSERECELASIAGYLHDIGNVISRYGHAQTGANISLTILERMGMPYNEVADIVSAIGNHDEKEGRVVNHVSAALILADKSDVHRSRVRNRDFASFDIHDRVNYAVKRSFLRIEKETGIITLELIIDLMISQVMEYFEIFLSRMVMCRRAAGFLDTQFSLVINETRLL